MKSKRTKDWSGKQLHGHFKRETEDISGVSRNLIRTGELKKETEGLTSCQARSGTKNKPRESQKPKYIIQMQNMW